MRMYQKLFQLFWGLQPWNRVISIMYVVYNLLPISFNTFKPFSKKNFQYLSMWKLKAVVIFWGQMLESTYEHNTTFLCQSVNYSYHNISKLRALADCHCCQVWQSHALKFEVCHFLFFFCIKSNKSLCVKFITSMQETYEHWNSCRFLIANM